MRRGLVSDRPSTRLTAGCNFESYPIEGRDPAALVAEAQPHSTSTRSGLRSQRLGGVF